MPFFVMAIAQGDDKVVEVQKTHGDARKENCISDYYSNYLQK